MSMMFQVLASGSKGNSILVCSSKTRVLLDAGLSARELVKRMERSPASASKLDALVITHEHQDHCRGAGVMSRRFGLPVYLTRGTLEHLPGNTGTLASIRILESGSPFVVGDLTFQPFSISHDAAEPVAYVVQNGDCRIGICTDLGVATQLVRTRLAGCNALVLESNHDREQLLNGPYPWPLKQRIRGRHGHLSNEESLELLCELRHDGLQSVTLAHLSETNNHPKIVRETFLVLKNDPVWETIDFAIGKQNEPNPEVEVP